jgi:hypothetical protein
MTEPDGELTMDDAQHLHLLFAKEIVYDDKPAIAIMPAHYDATAKYLELIGVDAETPEFNAIGFAELVRRDMDQFMANSVVEIMDELDKAQPGLDRYATAHHTLINRLAQQPAAFVANMLASAMVGFLESIDKDVNGLDASKLTEPESKPEPD